MTTETHTTRNSGYTLVELLMVVVLIGVLASTASMASGGQGETRLNLLETQIEDALEYAQSRARSTRSVHGVVFEPATERFGIIDETGSLVQDPLTRGDYVIDLGGQNQPGNLDLVSVDFAKNSVLLFDADGLPMTPGQVDIGCMGATRSLVLNQATGKLSTP